MRNRWDETVASGLSGLELRAWSARLIGEDPALMLHGGGSTSWKGEARDLQGRSLPALLVSGQDPSVAGFTAHDLEALRALAGAGQLSDAAFGKEIRRARLDPDAAPASPEAVVHALIPAAFVDHCRAAAVLTVSHTGGRAALEQAFGTRALILPYAGTGAALAQQVSAALLKPGISGTDAIVLEGRGVFTWGETARESYERMIAMCERAEAALAGLAPSGIQANVQAPGGIARLRSLVSRAAGRALVSLHAAMVPEEEVAALSQLAGQGVLAPDHTRWLKPFPALIGDAPEADLARFAQRFRALAGTPEGPADTPATPGWTILNTGEVRSFAPDLAQARIIADLAEANIRALRIAARIGQWQGHRAPASEPRHQPPPLPGLAGRIAVVSGAAAGIGRACAEALAEAGAVVVGLDVDQVIRSHMNREGYDSVTADLTDETAVARALEQVVSTYGGLDILVSNVGIFRAGAPVEALSDQVWDDTLAVNLTSHRKLLKQAIPWLRLGCDPSVVFIGSRNVAAPGPGAAAYSVSKAGLTQLMRVAAMELAPEGIRVNAVHPDAVFDTRLWTEEALETSARRYGLTVAQYKSRNLMRAEVRSSDVARAVLALVGDSFARTTGAQIPVDGGNDRVI